MRMGNLSRRGRLARQFCGFWSEVVDRRSKYGGEGPSLVSECSCVLSSGVQGREKVGLRVVQGRKQRRSNLTSGSSTCNLSAPCSLFPSDLKKGSLTTKTQRKESFSDIWTSFLYSVLSRNSG